MINIFVRYFLIFVPPGTTPLRSYEREDAAEVLSRTSQSAIIVANCQCLKILGSYFWLIWINVPCLELIDYLESIRFYKGSCMNYEGEICVLSCLPLQQQNLPNCPVWIILRWKKTFWSYRNWKKQSYPLVKGVLGCCWTGALVRCVFKNRNKSR